MARQRGVDTKVQITRGFVTEFTPLAFPQEAAIDIDNCIIDTDGSVRRRPGIDLEQKYTLNSINGLVLQSTEVESLAFTTDLWVAVSNSGTLNIVVQQVGSILQFFAQIGAVSDNLLGEVDLTAYAVDLIELPLNPVAMASGLGDLFVVGKHLAPVRISYDGVDFTVTALTIKIRDFTGITDDLLIDERPTALGRNHYYNLVNQGWTDENILTFAGLSTSTDICSATGGVGQLSAGGSDFPSNSDIMTTGIITNASGNLEFDPDFIRDGFAGNTPAPKGHFILDAFLQDYDAALGCPGTGSKIYTVRPEAVAFHQGRVFYTSPVVQNHVNGVFYSQQLITEDRAGNCYQEADPTAEEINDLVATDGGFLPTPGVGQIYKLVELANGVVIVASNGCWYITGADTGSGVSATSLRLDKISNFGALGAGSVVEAEGVLFYFGVEGIIQVQVDAANGAGAQNLTHDSIQTFYITIGANARADAVSVYIPEQRKVYWCYRDADAQESLTPITFNKFLILDLGIKGFYKYTIGESSQAQFPQIVGATLVRSLAANATEDPILELNGDIVTELDGIESVTEISTSNLGQITQLKLATVMYSTLVGGWQTTFSTFNSRSFTDWRNTSVDGIGLPMESFIEFAEFNMGAVHTKGTPTYVHSYFQKTSKNLQPGGYYELPPLFYESTGLRVSQSVLEVLNRPSSNLKLSQSILEVLTSPPSDFRFSQSVLEVLSDVTAGQAAAVNLVWLDYHNMNDLDVVYGDANNWYYAMSGYAPEVIARWRTEVGLFEIRKPGLFSTPTLIVETPYILVATEL